MEKILFSLDGVNINESMEIDEFYENLLKSNDLPINEHNVRLLDEYFINEQILLEMSEETKQKIKNILKKIGIGIGIGALAGLSVATISKLTGGAIKGSLAKALSAVKDFAQTNKGKLTAAGIGAGAGAVGAGTAAVIADKQHTKRSDNYQNGDLYRESYENENQAYCDLLESSNLDVSFRNIYRLKKDLENKNAYVNTYDDSLPLLVFTESDTVKNYDVTKENTLNGAKLLFNVLFNSKLSKNNSYISIGTGVFANASRFTRDDYGVLVGLIKQRTNLNSIYSEMINLINSDRQTIKSIYKKFIQTVKETPNVLDQIKSYIGNKIFIEFKYTNGDYDDVFNSNYKNILTEEYLVEADIPEWFRKKFGIDKRNGRKRSDEELHEIRGYYGNPSNEKELEQAMLRKKEETAKRKAEKAMQNTPVEKVKDNSDPTDEEKAAEKEYHSEKARKAREEAEAMQNDPNYNIPDEKPELFR